MSGGRGQCLFYPPPSYATNKVHVPELHVPIHLLKFILGIAKYDTEHPKLLNTFKVKINPPTYRYLAQFFPKDYISQTIAFGSFFSSFAENRI